ncbi:MAG TPA: hypothetical protein VFC44_20695 [Candidatus Saccharimonadales bacterium]|nr:hypothetical protein [Candidatus Saccharimonadales bacterium]
MKTITLRTLVREPRKVKGMTRAGNSVQVTDKGQPLWIIQPAIPAMTEHDEKLRRHEVEEELAVVLREPRSRISASEIILASRR